MTLEKAIELVQLHIGTSVYTRDPDLRQALKLCIEAGKRVQWHKEQHASGYYEPLPGETEV